MVVHIGADANYKVDCSHVILTRNHICKVTLGYKITVLCDCVQ